MHKDNILIVDDEPNVLSALKRLFDEGQLVVHTAGTAEEAMNILKANPVKVIISDERMPTIKGSQLLSMVREQYPRTVRIMLTGYADIEAAIKAVNEGEIYRFFTKPWDDEEIRKTVWAAISRYNAGMT